MTETRNVKTMEFAIEDSKGNLHNGILVAVVDTTKFKKNLSKVSEQLIKGKKITTYTNWEEDAVIKNVYLGLSISNPEDEYNFEKGFLRAKGRALKPSKRLGEMGTNSRGMLNDAMIDVIMEQQIEFIQNNYDLFFVISNNFNENTLGDF